MSNYLCLYAPGMCGTWLTWLINQHSNFPQYDLALKSYNSSLEDGKIVRKTLDVGCFGADWFTYKYIPKESSYYDENTVAEFKRMDHILDYTFKENRENNQRSNNSSATKDCVKVLPNHNSAKDYGISKEKWHNSPTEVRDSSQTEKFSHSVNKELLKNITDDMQPEKIIVPVFNYQGDDTIIKRWLIYRKTHNLSEHAIDKWCHFNITVQDVHLNGAIEFWKDSWAEYSKWVQQDNPYGNNVHYVDIEKLISGDNDEYLKLCEAINETPIDNIQEEITSYKNILLDVVADFDYYKSNGFYSR